MMDRLCSFELLARAVVDAEIGEFESPDQVGRAIDATFRQLQEVVSTMVGEAGFQALMRRALHMTRTRSPKDVVFPSELAACAPYERWAIAVEHVGASEAKDCAARLLAALLDLLASFIGGDLTFRLVRRTWHEEDESRSRRAQGAGSSSTPEGGLQ